MNVDLPIINYQDLIAAIALDRRLPESQELYEQYLQSILPLWRPQGGLVSTYVTAKSKTIEMIEELENLSANWDGYQALPIHPDAIRAAKGLVDSLPTHFVTADVCPNPNGTVSLEWQNDKGRAHLEIGKTRYSFYIKPVFGNAIPICEENQYLPIQIPQILDSMLSPRMLPVDTINQIHYSFNYGLAGSPV